MVILDNILYLSVKDLTAFGFSDGALRTKCKEYRQGLSQSYRNIPGRSSKEKVLIAFDSIPESTRFEKNLPAKEELIKLATTNTIGSMVRFHDGAYNYYLTQPATKHIAKQKAEEFAWYLAIAGVSPTEAKQNFGATDKEDFLLKAVDAINKRAKDAKWHAFKLSTVAELRKRLTPFKQYLKNEISLQECCGARVSKKAENDNAGKIKYDQKALIVQLYSDPLTKINYEQCFDIYTRKANEMIAGGLWAAKALVKESTVRAFLNKPAVKQLWYEARNGYQEYRNVFDPVVQRERASYANELWVIDGTPLHRYFQHLDKGKYYRWNIFVILDAYSHAVLGFWISESENAQAVLGALRAACMVSGKMPYQVLYDNGSAINSYLSQHAIDTISVTHFAAQAGNARSKVVEGYFHWFNENVEKFRIGFTHNPFASRLENRPNREALAVAIREKRLPLAENAIDELIIDFTLANSIKRKFLGNKSALDAYRESVKATAHKQREFTDAIDIEAFYSQPGEHKKIRTYHEGKQTLINTWVPQLYEFTNRGIDITINGKKFTYDIEEPAFRAANIGQKFSVRYEPNSTLWSNGQQPDKLLLYVQGKPVQWQGMHLAALPKELMPMAIADYGQGTRAELDRRLANKRTQREMVRAEFERMIEHTKTTGTYTDLSLTENAFDKEVLQAVKAEEINRLIGGEDYDMTQAPEVREKVKVIDRWALGEDENTTGWTDGPVDE